MNSVIKDSSGNSYKVTSDESKAPAVEYKKPAKKSTEIEIPENVTIDGVQYQVESIADNAFKNHKKLTKLVIPASVKKIGKNTFKGCKSKGNGQSAEEQEKGI